MIEPTAVGAAMFWGALIVIVAALFVVFVTATFGYVRAKRLALEREMRDEHVCHECEPADRR